MLCARSHVPTQTNSPPWIGGPLAAARGGDDGPPLTGGTLHRRGVKENLPAPSEGVPRRAELGLIVASRPLEAQALFVSGGPLPSSLLSAACSNKYEPGMNSARPMSTMRCAKIPQARRGAWRTGLCRRPCLLNSAAGYDGRPELDRWPRTLSHAQREAAGRRFILYPRPALHRPSRRVNARGRGSCRSSGAEAWSQGGCGNAACCCRTLGTARIVEMSQGRARTAPPVLRP